MGEKILFKPYGESLIMFNCSLYMSLPSRHAFVQSQLMKTAEQFVKPAQT